MNPTTTNTNFTDSKTRNIRVGGSRRAYLDTYAKKRSTESIKPASQHPERQKYVASIPMSYEASRQEVAKPVVAQPVGAAVIEVEAPVAQTAPKGKSTAIDSDYVARKPTDPVKIVISSIGVNAQVEGLGITSDGLIAVPKAYGLVGWYNKGKTVGEAGPAVMVGHYASGGGAVFDKLGSTKNGDLITVTNGKGESFTYKVTKKVEYPKDKVPMKQVFKGGSESRLEIITCQGAWQGSNYDKRLVVTAELVK